MRHSASTHQALPMTLLTHMAIKDMRLVVLAFAQLGSEWFPLDPFPAGLYVLVGAGALMMAVGFFGCCGAMRESQCVLGSVSGARGTRSGLGKKKGI